MSFFYFFIHNKHNILSCSNCFLVLQQVYDFPFAFFATGALNTKQTVKANLHEMSIKVAFISTLCHVKCPLEYLLSKCFLFVGVKREPGQVNKDKHVDLITWDLM